MKAEQLRVLLLEGHTPRPTGCAQLGGTIFVPRRYFTGDCSPEEAALAYIDDLDREEI